MNYKAEILIEDGKIFLYIDAELKLEDELTLRADGWEFLNNGIELEDGTPALLFFKKNSPVKK